MSVFSVVISALRKLVDTALLIVTQILKLVFLPVRIVLYPFTAIWSSLRGFYKKYYGDSAFVNILDNSIPECGNTVNSNRCDISWQLEEKVIILFFNAFFFLWF